MHHVSNSHEWLVPFGRVHLPGFLPVHALMLIIGCFFLLLTFGVLYRKNAPVPRGLTNLLELFVLFIRDQICIPSLGEKDGRQMTPLFCSFFFFILCMNLMGIIPLFSAATGNVNVTAALASITLGLMIFGTIYKHGVRGFYHALAPAGVPWPVLILLVPIEFVSLFIKSLALTIRLFANMLAGHIVLFVLVGLIVLFGWIAALPVAAMIVGIYFLEIFVALLQSYIFTLLSAIFIGLMYHPEH